MHIDFSKMHGLGNDFMVIERITQTFNMPPDLVKHWANRHTGVGFDQLLLVSPSPDKEHDFTYRIFNADGSEVEQCGNGARCFALFVKRRGLCDKETVKVLTMGGSIVLNILQKTEVQVDMGVPIFEPVKIPFKSDTGEQQDIYGLQTSMGMQSCAVLSMGNPHCVIMTDDVDKAPVQQLGAELAVHPSFPQGVNVGFLQIIDQQTARLRVYERGTGETLACGSGACAAMVAANLRGLLGNEAKIQLPGGDLKIAWEGPGQPVLMTGTATHIYDGNIRIPEKF